MDEATLMLQAGEMLRAAGTPVTPANVERYLKRVTTAGLLVAQQRAEDFIARCRARTAAAPRRPATLQTAITALNAAADKLPAPTLAQEVATELAKPELKGKYIAYVDERAGMAHTFALPRPYTAKEEKK